MLILEPISELEENTIRTLRSIVHKAGYPRTLAVNKDLFNIYEEYMHRCQKNWGGEGQTLLTRDGIGILFKNVEIYPV